MALIAKSDLLSLSIETKEIDVPGSENKLRIRALTGAQVVEARKLYNRGVDEVGKITNPAAWAEYEIYCFQHGVIDDDGNEMLSKDEVRIVQGQRYSLVALVAVQVSLLSGLGKEAADDAEKK